MSSISSGTTLTTALVQTADTSGVLQLQTNGGTTALTLDTSQNAGFGVTPSGWTGGPATQFKYGGSVWNNSDSSFHISENAYFNGSWNYISGTSASATNYFQSIGTHNWRYASAGTGALTWTTGMTLNNSGSLVFGVSGQGVSFNNASTPSSGTITGYTISSSGSETTFTDNGTTVTSNSISIPTGVWVISSVTQIVDATGTSNSTAWWAALTTSSTYSISNGTNNSNFQYDHNIQYAQSTSTLQSSSYKGRIINSQVVSNTSGSNVTYYAIAATNGSSTAVWGIRTQMMAVKVY